MEILAVIGILLLGLIVFVGGGLFGWGLKGLGAVFGLLSEGWSSCLTVIVWIIIFFFVLLAFAL